MASTWKRGRYEVLALTVNTLSCDNPGFSKKHNVHNRAAKSFEKPSRVSKQKDATQCPYLRAKHVFMKIAALQCGFLLPVLDTENR